MAITHFCNLCYVHVRLYYFYLILLLSKHYGQTTYVSTISLLPIAKGQRLNGHVNLNTTVVKCIQ